MGILSFAVTCWSALPINHPSVPFSEIAVITYGIGMLQIIGAQQFSLYLGHPLPFNLELVTLKISSFVMSLRILPYGRKKLTHIKKVGRKQNIITFFLLEIGQKFKQV
jgi:hypothetical protein